MQFQVPQFIETEDKIVGPLTIKQFLYLTGATLAVFFLYFVLVPWLWVIVGVVVEGAAVSLSLIKINGRPMITVASSAFMYVWGPRVYVYHSLTEGAAVVAPTPTIWPAIPRPSGGGLRGLLDKLTTTKEAIPKRESPLPEVLRATSNKSMKERYELIRKITGDEEVARRVDYR